MANLFKTLSLSLAAVTLSFGVVVAAESPLTAKDVSFSFDGVFGKFDKAQLQRGYKVYKEVCASCHSMKYVAFRNLADPGALGFSRTQVEELAATFTVKDGPDSNGDMFDRPGVPSDYFPMPFANDEAAAAANGGAVPPDLSLITKARAGWTGTINQLFNGIGGPQYVYSVLTGYEDTPEEEKGAVPEGKYYNPYFSGGVAIGMAPPLSDGQVTFDDGAPNTAEAMARDVAAFLAWSAEPKMEARKAMGFPVLIFLTVFAALLYLVKKQIWSKQH